MLLPVAEIKPVSPAPGSLAEQAVELCRQWRFSRSLGLSLSILGRVRMFSGRAAEAVSLMEEGLRRTDAVGMTWLRCPRLSDLAEAYLKVGRLHDAVEWAMKAAEAARQRGEHGFEAWALRLLAEIELVRQPPDASAAERRYGEARALASTLGMRPLLAHCHHGLAEVYRRMDRRPEAHEHLTTATTMYREMDMRFWLEQARRKWVD